MILHIFESGRHIVAPKLWAGWSAATHAAVVAGVVGSAYAPAPPPDDVERARYVLPRLPKGASADATVERLSWVGLGPERDADVARGGPPAPRARPVEQVVARTGGGALPVVVMHAAPDTGDTPGTPVYLEELVDVPAERDAASDGPAYPEPMRLAGIEGAVEAEYVVDSAGRADPSTFRTLAASDPLFEAAVREALPRMLFRPARMGVRPVAQLIRQAFAFRMASALSLPADSAPP